MDAHQLNVASHVGTGALALLIGLVPLFSRKGGPLHRWSGRATVGLGAVVLASAVIADVLFDPPAPLVAATLSAGYQYLSGLRTLALKRAGPGWPDVALALTGLGLVTLLGLHMGSGTASWPPAIGYATIGFIATVIVYDLSRHLWIGLWRRQVRPLDHGVKMIGFYFAMLSARAGNLLEQWQPLSQVLPSAIGMVAMVGFVVWYSLNPIGRREMAAA
ncbi:hypothetical protein BZG35_10920 [Brevundimonas sp. LM2]|uniref:hypothetical protein n=1 Tax=Brevundimonas sp. LM2 TaxID=1938605 RepID=UPI000983F68F|nr:hypothetical protein [Brevundimonas sp. LM2]AQR62098.1 hypothetical protein BZG35_10920 [Brevundimonas sp. LM2]